MTEEHPTAKNFIFAKETLDIELVQILAKWDLNEPVTTIEMGGLGDGYEQCIQILSFELLRLFLNSEVARVDLRDPDKYKEIREKISDPLVYQLGEKYGFSGAQVGAAYSLSTSFYLNGYKETLKMVKEDRLIQSSKNSIIKELEEDKP